MWDDRHTEMKKAYNLIIVKYFKQHALFSLAASSSALNFLKKQANY